MTSDMKLINITTPALLALSTATEACLVLAGTARSGNTLDITLKDNGELVCWYYQPWAGNGRQSLNCVPGKAAWIQRRTAEAQPDVWVMFYNNDDQDLHFEGMSASQVQLE